MFGIASWLDTPLTLWFVGALVSWLIIVTYDLRESVYRKRKIDLADLEMRLIELFFSVLWFVFLPLGLIFQRRLLWLLIASALFLPGSKRLIIEYPAEN